MFCAVHVVHLNNVFMTHCESNLPMWERSMCFTMLTSADNVSDLPRWQSNVDHPKWIEIV